MPNRVIVGVDEAGRGTWAGPLVAAAVVMYDNAVIDLFDSKSISKKRREELSGEIKKVAISIGIGWASPSYIDKHGITLATSLAMQTAVNQLGGEFNEVVIDGNVKYLPGGQYRYVVKADQTFPAVSAASIIAKTSRDSYMSVISSIYPEYGFDKHFGYGTKLHVEALTKYGTCSIHRLSYKPVKTIHDNCNRS